MSSQLRPLSFGALCIALVSGLTPVQAQQRVEVRRAAPRAESDTLDRQLRLVQRKLDSLFRVYNERGEISNFDRRRVEEAITALTEQLRPRIMTRSTDEMDRAATIGATRVQLAPLGGERTSAAITRAMMQVREGAQSQLGWIGFWTEGANVRWADGGEQFVRYVTYPRVVSVDPSSPAQRAGIEPSDTLIAYDGRDVRATDISLTQLLRPSSKVSVRLRRDGKVLEVPVTVAVAPTRIIARRDDEARELRIESGVAIAGGLDGPRTVRSLAPTPPPSSGSLVAPRAPGMFQMIFTNNGVAGAQLQMISGDEWIPMFGVSSGVLVVMAPPGSPARESGLQGSDLILRVGGQAVRTVVDVRDLVRIATENGERAIDLEILRNRKPMKVALKW